MISVNGITKTYGKKTSVENLSFNVEKGHVVGFLGPNGSGKSTTMRMILGLDKPNEGEVLIDGKRYEELKDPLTVVGSLLNASALQKGRTARQHLKIIAAANAIQDERIEECLNMVGLNEVADREATEFSLGMKQRLGIAAALLGDPDYLILDEPVNGLDPVGIHWVREFMTNLAINFNKGILISSHQIGELSKMAHDLVVIGNGKLISASTMEEFTENAKTKIDVSSPQIDILSEELKKIKDVKVEKTSSGIVVSGAPSQMIGEIALRNSIVLTQLTNRNSLEEAFLSATHSAQEFDQK